MRCMHISLLNYAHEHEGWFPRGADGAMASLRLLYPDYCPVGGELAGLSGNVDATLRVLRAGDPLTESISSWRYRPGLRVDDDPRLAVLWEDQYGLRANGVRTLSRSRAVLLVNGDITNVIESAWEGFVSGQMALKTAAEGR
jgi:hypothetical protein